MMTSGGRVRLGTMLTLALLLAATVGLAPQPGLAQAAGCWAEAPTLAGGYPQWTTPPQQVIDPDGSYTATVETNRGPIVIELLPAQAPTAVNNFVCLALAGYYDVTVFHRIIEGFMIQGGDPTGTGTGGPGYQFADEVPTGEAPYTRGTVAMANAGPNTNGSQFFIVHQDQPAEFPANYSIFGRVVEGMETVDAIAAAPVTGSAARPEEQSSPLATLGIKEITITDGTGQPLAAEVAPEVAASPVAGTAATAEATTAAEPTVAPAATVEDDDDGSNLGLWIAIGAALLAGIGYFLWSQRRRAPAAPAARSRTQVRRTEPVTAEPEVAADPPAGTRPAPRTQSRPKPQRRQRKK